jgi:hypothetical protein
MRIRSCLLALALAACAHRQEAAGPVTAGAAAVGAAAAGRCSGQPYVELANPLPERAYVQLVTASGRTFYVDEPLGPKEARRIETPRSERVVRAYVATEAWNVERGRGRPAANRSTSTLVEVRPGCTPRGARAD